MAKSLIIGGASGYTWDHLKYWVNSIKRSGYTGDIAIVATNISKETIDKLASEDVNVQVYGQQQPDGSFKANSQGAPHVERFFYIWNYLKDRFFQYDYVITTDTRDVVFQTDPTEVLDSYLNENNPRLIASSEGLRYEDEPWGNQNLLEAFGPYFHNIYKSGTIYNVGTIAGYSRTVTDLLFLIFQMSINRPIPIVDQAVYNILLNQDPIESMTHFSDNRDRWAIQLGTTLEAVKSGKGDLGMRYGTTPSQHIVYQTMYDDIQPVFLDGYVLNDKGEKYCIVHQYDRTVEWKDKIMEKYND